jgi:hypothetical protein
MSPESRNPVEAWNALVDFTEGSEGADDPDLDAVEKLSKEELQAELAAHGLARRPGDDATAPWAVPSPPASAPDVVLAPQVIDVEPPPATVTKLEPKRGPLPGVPYLLAAAAAVLLLLAAYFVRLWGDPHQANPDHPEPSVHVPTPTPPSATLSPAPVPVAPIAPTPVEPTPTGPKGPPGH